jgi:hypothetical protein
MFDASFPTICQRIYASFHRLIIAAQRLDGRSADPKSLIAKASRSAGRNPCMDVAKPRTLPLELTAGDY